MLKLNVRPIGMLLSLAAIWLLTLNCVHAQDGTSPKDRELLDELRTGLRAVCAVNPMLIKFQLVEFHSAEYLKATSELKEPSEFADEKLPRGFKDTETVMEVEYALKGNKQAYRKSGQGIWQTREGASVVDMKRTAAFNDVLAVSTDYTRDQTNPAAVVYVISRNASLVRKPALPTFLSFQEMLLLELESMQNNRNQSKLRIADDDSSGQVQLVFSYSSGEECRYWLDRTQKFSPVKCKHMINQSVRTESATKYLLVNGTPFPSEVVWVQFVNSEKPAWRQTFKLRSLEVEAAKIPDALFNVEIPASAAIYNKDTGVWKR